MVIPERMTTVIKEIFDWFSYETPLDSDGKILMEGSFIRLL